MLQCHNDVTGKDPAVLLIHLSDLMPSIDDFRFTALHRLLDLDEATTRLMMLVVSRDVSGSRWEEAVSLHKSAYEAWAAMLTPVEIDPMLILDARPVEGSVHLSD